MYGKIIGGILGFLAGGVIGLIIGVVVGHTFDRGLVASLHFGSSENIQRINTSFFETTFLLSGYLAKADGQVTAEEIEHTEAIFRQMGLDTAQRQRGIELFRRGAAADFQLEVAISAFLQVAGTQRQLKQILLSFLISLAMADHTLAPAEQTALRRIAGLLGFSEAELAQLLRMSQAQEQFHGEQGYAAQSGTSLEDAYSALGVSNAVTDKELKFAYRKLMSQHHPDKLIAKGVPEDMIKLATARSQEIQAAYEMVRKSRG